MPFDDGDRIRLAHGFGGQLTQELIEEIILPALTGEHGNALTLDAAVVPDLTSPMVISIDSFTVSPRFFPGGDIGELAVAGTSDSCSRRDLKSLNCSASWNRSAPRRVLLVSRS